MFPLLRSQVPAARRSIAALSKCQRHRRLGHFGRLFTSSTIQSANSISGHRRRWLQMTPSSHLHQQHGDFVQHREHGPIFVSREVWEAISSRSAVVALESTIITHGMTFPANLETALQVESIIRQNGSVPATIGIIDGNVFVGLQPQQLEQLAQKGTGRQGRTVKVSRSDLPVVVASGWCGGTTVSATSYLANLVGIRVFVTGGIGGVHRGAEVTMDISADLSELARTPITVVSAGVKSILDIGKTLEVLETNGVCVAVYQGEEDNATGQVKFPAFFTPDSGISVAYNLKTATAVAKLMHSRDALQLESAILLAVPNESKEGREYHRKVEEALELAQREMREQGIQGKKVTPFLLARISELTGGESLKLNQQLIEHNALVGAQISREYSRLGCPASPPPPPSNRSPSGLANKTGPGNSSSGLHQGKWSNAANKLTASDLPTGAHSSPSTPVVIGGSIYDIVTKAHGAVQLDGSTYHGSLQTSLGGVARNISDCIFKLGQEECLLITAVGKDLQGQLVRQNNPNAITSGIRMVDDLPTSACAVTIDGNGECVLLVGDMRVHQHIDRDFVAQFERQLSEAPMVIMDGNIATTTMDYVLDVCRQNRVPVWFEPTDPTLVTKILDQAQIAVSHFEAIKFLSPNFYELQLLCREVFGDQFQVVDSKYLNRDDIIRVSSDCGHKLLAHFDSFHAVLVTIGAHGIVYVSRDADVDSPMHLGPNSKLFDSSSTSKASQALFLPQEKVSKVVNVSGAGDCMVGAIVCGFLRGQSIQSSLQLGLKAARVSVTAADTVPADIQQIIAAQPLR